MSLIRTELRFLRALLRDPRTPAPAKWLIGAGIAYLVSPIDFVPDVLPVIGQIDDVLIVPTLVGMGLAIIPKHVKQDIRKRTARQLTGPFGEEPMMCFETEALEGTFGVRVVHVDTGRARGSELLLGLLELAMDHRVVVIDSQIGQSLIEPLEREFNLTDIRHTTLPISMPSKLASQFHIEVAKSRGEIELIDLVGAYEALPERHKRDIEKLMIRPRRLYRTPINPNPEFKHLVVGEIANSGDEGGITPLAIRHPVSGRIGLVPSFEECEVCGEDNESTADLLEELARHIQRPEFRSSYHLSDGDVLSRDVATTMTPAGLIKSNAARYDSQNQTRR